VFAVRKTRMSVALAAAVVAAGMAPGCNAQETCPWLNTPTASGALGGPAQVTVVKSGDTVEACAFQLPKGSPIGSMRITVTAAADEQKAHNDLEAQQAHCAAASAIPLKAIGDEAVLCEAGTRKAGAEQVIGRVRNNIFIVTMNEDGPPEHPSLDSPLGAKAQLIAEQVAGALF